MFSWAITFLVIALVAAALGFGGLAGTAMSAAQIQQWLRLVWNTLLKIHWKQASQIVAEFKRHPQTNQALVKKVEEQVASTAAYATDDAHGSKDIQFIYEWCAVSVANMDFMLRFMTQAITTPSAEIVEQRKKWNRHFLQDLEKQYQKQTQYATTFAYQNANRRVQCSQWPTLRFMGKSTDATWIVSDASREWRTAQGVDAKTNIPYVTNFSIDTTPEPVPVQKRKETSDQMVLETDINVLTGAGTREDQIIID